MNKWHKFEFRPNDAVWKLDKMFLSYESEKGYSYGFIEISVGIYRTSTPESVVRSSETVVLTELEEPAKTIDFSFEGTVFRYGEQAYDVTSRVEAINSIMDAVPVGEKIIVQCHVGPKNAVYCIFDTASQSFENDLIGCNLVWYDNDIKTAVYSYWSDIYT